MKFYFFSGMGRIEVALIIGILRPNECFLIGEEEKKSMEEIESICHLFAAEFNQQSITLC